jgi:hypothetical protein
MVYHCQAPPTVAAKSVPVFGKLAAAAAPCHHGVIFF